MKNLFKIIILLILLLIASVVLKQQFGQQDTPLPSSSPEAFIPEPNYTDPNFGYRIYIPNGFTAHPQNSYSTLFYPPEQTPGPGPTNFLYVSVVTPDMRESAGEVYNYNPTHFQKLIALENVGDSVDLASDDIPDLGAWFTYTVVEEIELGSGRVKNFENTQPWEFPAGTTENRFIYGTNENIYLLGYYTGGDTGTNIDPRMAYQSILSFQTK